MEQLNFRQWFRQCVCVCTTLAVVTLIFPTAAQPDDDTAVIESKIKAAFIYKFTNYIEWPQNLFSQPDTPITIAVMGDNQLAVELNQVVAGRTANGRRIIVSKLKDIDPSTVIHILFVGQNARAQIGQIIKALEGRPVVIVTEWEGALAQGGIINFLLIDEHVRFEIALDSAEKRGLKLSSELLTVAQSVRTETP
jgi:hypothetical protein